MAGETIGTGDKEIMNMHLRGEGCIINANAGFREIWENLDSSVINEKKALQFRPRKRSQRGGGGQLEPN